LYVTDHREPTHAIGHLPLVPETGGNLTPFILRGGSPQVDWIEHFIDDLRCAANDLGDGSFAHAEREREVTIGAAGGQIA
jgi:hypothetical protein